MSTSLPGCRIVTSSTFPSGLIIGFPAPAALEPSSTRAGTLHSPPLLELT